MSTSVLIVDDMGFMREILRSICESSGYRVLGEAEDGIEAFEKIQSLKPDIAIVDLVMPKMSGLELIEKLMEMENPPDILICTTLEEKYYSEKLNSLGAFKTIAKPFKKAEVAKALNQLTKQKERKHA